MKKDSKNNNDELNYKTIIKFMHSEKGKRYSFVIFYSIFFIFLFIFINNTKNTTIEVKDESSLPFVTSNLENNDYSFKYTVDGNNINEYLIFKKNNQYEVQSDIGIISLTKKNGELICSDNEILHCKLLDMYVIKKIIKTSKQISILTLTESNELIYDYQITNLNLGLILNQNLNESLTNDIKIYTNNQKEITKIEFDLTNYEKEINNDLTKLLITIEIGDNFYENSFS